jgi:microtubule-associated protein-like 6
VLRDGEAIKGRFMKKEKLDATTSGEKEVAATKEKNNDIQDVLCVEFLRNGAVVSGMPDGEVYYWLPSDTEDMGVDGTTKKPVWYLADKLRWGDGKKAHRQPVQAIVLRCKGKGKGKRNTDGGGWQLMTGGAGGVIKFWSAPKDGDPLYDSAAAACSPLFMVELEARVPGQPAPGIKALDTLAKGKGELLVGTDKCDLWRLKLNDDGAASGEKLERLKPGTGGGKGYRLTQMVKGHRKDVEGLDCHPTYEGVFATCSESERIFLWDARAHLQLSEGMLKTGGVTRTASKLAFRPDGARLAVGTHEGAVFIFRSDEAALKTGRLVPLRRGPDDARARLPLHDCVQKIAELKYSPDSRTLAVASHDQFIDLYDAEDDSYKRLYRCRGHSATVSHIDWSVDCKVIMSQCNAYELLYWDTDRDCVGWKQTIGRQLADDQRDVKWHSWSSTLGFDVLGIWPPDYDNTDINMVARSHEVKGYGRYVACATDFGGVLLFNYPAVVKNGPHYWYPGHSSHTKNIKWLAPLSPLPPAEGEAAAGDQSAICYCMSAGGHDRSIFQWRLVNDGKPKVEEEPEEETPALPEPAAAAASAAPGEGLKSDSFLEQKKTLEAQEEQLHDQEATIAELRRKLLELERGV